MFISLGEVSNLVCLEMLHRFKPQDEETALKMWSWNIKQDITANRFLQTYILDVSYKVDYYKKCKVNYLVIEYFDDRLTQGFTIHKYDSEESIKHYLSTKKSLKRVFVIYECQTMGISKDDSNVMLLTPTGSNNSPHLKTLSDLDSVGDGYWQHLDNIPCNSIVSTVLKSSSPDNFT